MTPERVTIRASHAAGLFYGVQSFRQLLPAFVEYDAVRPDKARPVVAAAARIADRPRFAWRGAMLDVARHFLSVAEVKRFVDLMVIYKLNRLHLHLADDQGWRVEIRAWPKLTAHGGSTEVGGGAGGYYTQAEYADLVDYASKRFVTVVPEIDMPGHTNAALASYAELNCDGKARELYTGIEVGFSALCVDHERTYAFISDVVREIAAITPGPWFHIGGDEVKTLTPRQYGGFIERVQTIVQSHGKHMIGWDEVSASRLSADVDRAAVATQGQPRGRGVTGGEGDHVCRQPGVPGHEIRSRHPHRAQLGRLYQCPGRLRVGPGCDHCGTSLNRRCSAWKRRSGRKRSRASWTSSTSHFRG